MKNVLNHADEDRNEQMHHKYNENHQKKMSIFLFSIIIWIIWLVSIYLSRGIFLNTRNDNPLAMIDSLSILYYLSLVLLIILSLYYFSQGIQSRVLDLLLLVQFGFILWYTPNYLSGFIYEPPGIYHAGVANYIPNVLRGEPFVVAVYGKDYPGSFILSYAIIKITGLEINVYVNEVFPIIYIPMFTLLWYLFVSKLSNPRVAFLSILIAFPGLHYFKIYPSPQTVGTIMVLTCIILILTRTELKARILGVMSLGCIFFTHPISPVIALIFISAFIIMKVPVRRPKLSYKYFILLGGIIAAAYVVIVTSPTKDLIDKYFERLPKVLSASPISKISDVVSDPQFLYPEIYILNQLIYVVYFLLALVLLIYIFIRGFRTEKGIKQRIFSGMIHVGRKRFFLLLASVLFIFFGAMLFLITTFQDLIERSLTFFILVISIFIATIILDFEGSKKASDKDQDHKISLWRKGFNSRMKTIYLIGSLLIPLVIIFPLVAYSIGVYNTTPPSEHSGMEFLSENVPLDNERCSMTLFSQLAMYLEPPINVSLPSGRLYATGNIDNPPYTVVFRSSGFYYFAMRFDLSLEDNRFTRFRSEMNNNSLMNNIYANPSFEIYLRNSYG